MKCEVIINPEGEEKVVIYAKEHRAWIDRLQHLTETEEKPLLGYRDRETIPLDCNDILFITVENGKVTAVCEDGRWQLKERLYALESNLPLHFVKLNQSCLANIRKIQRFDSSLAGTLHVRFVNGDTDYVSRRQLKSVKERFGMKR